MISIARIFGAPVIEPPGKAARSRSSDVLPAASLPDDGRDQVLDVLIRFQFAQLGDGDAIRLADSGQIVAQQVDDHHVLGPILLALPQIVARVQVGLGTVPPRPCALDRASFHPPVANLQKPLGRRADDLVRAQIESSRRTGPGSPVAAAGTAVAPNGEPDTAAAGPD